MDIFASLAGGFVTVATAETLFFCFVGVMVGTLVGVLPGLGATATMAILLPISINLSALDAMVMLAGVYYGSKYGGAITAILLNTPGEPSAIPVVADGYALAKAGKGGPALVLNAVGSFLGGSVALVALTFLAPWLSDVALAMGPPEYFCLMVAAVTVISSFAGESLTKALLAGLGGFAIHFVGLDSMSAQMRFTFGIPDLISGLDFVAIIIGLFAISEVLENFEVRSQNLFQKIQRYWPTREEVRKSVVPGLRGGVLGTIIGAMPGGSGTTAAFLAYDVERRLSKTPETFGKGEYKGIVAAEGAGNAATGGGMVPMLTLGIPADPAIAVLLSALIMQGVQPGPGFFSEHTELAWAIIASMYVGNLALLAINIPLVRIWVAIVRIPYPILAVGILSISVIGAYGSRNNMIDVWVMFIFGIVGYVMRKTGVPPAPMIFAIVLASLMEPALRQSLAMSGGDATIFLTRPVCVLFLIAGLLLVALGVRSRRNIQSKVAKAEAGSSE